MTDPALVPAAQWSIAKRFVTVAGKEVHYRVCGDGPSIVMLHEAPRSSRVFADIMPDLAHRYRVYALDTPGYGNSDPLDQQPLTIDHFAKALSDALEALELSHCPLYARYSNAKIALHYALHYGKPSKLILDGLSISSSPPDDTFVRSYMRVFELDPEGAYLTGEWTRMRDTFRWFPWFDRIPERRRRSAMPDEARIDAQWLDLLSAGPHFSDAYAVAMQYDPTTALRQIAVPTIVAAREDDLLFAHLDRIPTDSSAYVTVAPLPSGVDQWIGWLGEAFDAPSPCGGTPKRGATETSPKVYLDLSHGQMLVHLRRLSSGPVPLLILEAPALIQAPIWQSHLTCPTIVPELPGYGESDPLHGSIADQANSLAEMLDALSIRKVNLLGLGWATSLAVAFALQYPDRVDHLVLDGTASLEADANHISRDAIAPDFLSNRASGHILSFWHMLRDSEVQWPWFDESVSAQRRVTPTLDPGLLHRALTDVLKQPERYGDIARAGIGVCHRYGEIARPVVLLDFPSDPAYAATLLVSSQIVDAHILEREADIPSTAAIVEALLHQTEGASMANPHHRAVS